MNLNELDLHQCKEYKHGLIRRGFLSFGILAIEILIIPIMKLITKDKGQSHNASFCIYPSNMVIHWSITIAIWIAWVIYIVKWSRKNNLSLFNFYFNKRNILLIISAIVLGVMLAFISDGGFKPHIIAENVGFAKMYGKQWDLPLSVFQNLYYLAEILIVSTAVFIFQYALELITGRNLIPWGGLSIGLFWGLGHIFTGHITAAIPLLIISMVMGCMAILSKKNFLTLYLGLLITFII